MKPTHTVSLQSWRAQSEVPTADARTVLIHDPLTVDPKMLKDIKVLETIKEGKTVYLAR